MSHPVLGTVDVYVTAAARLFKARVRDGRLYVVMPPSRDVAGRLSRVLDDHLDGLQRLLADAGDRVRLLGADFRIDADHLHLRCALADCTDIHCVLRGETALVTLPAGQTSEALDENIRRAAADVLNRVAHHLLPPRLEALAARWGFHYRGVKIQSSRTRWGSCSTAGNINLSHYLVLLPDTLIDYVLLHELCHTVHMDHSPSFWDALDHCTDGRARELRAALRRHSTDL